MIYKAQIEKGGDYQSVSNVYSGRSRQNGKPSCDRRRENLKTPVWDSENPSTVAAANDLKQATTAERTLAAG